MLTELDRFVMKWNGEHPKKTFGAPVDRRNGTYAFPCPVDIRPEPIIVSELQYRVLQIILAGRFAAVGRRTIGHLVFQSDGVLSGSAMASLSRSVARLRRSSLIRGSRRFLACTALGEELACRLYVLNKKGTIFPTFSVGDSARAQP